MAFTPLIPVNMNIVISPPDAQAYISPAVLGLTSGTALNLSAWTSLQASIVPPAPSPTGAPVTFGTVTGGATGLLTLETNATDLASVPAGNAQLRITGKPTSGDIVQLLATGTVTIQQG
jgi:hypothetical protein